MFQSTKYNIKQAKKEFRAFWAGEFLKRGKYCVDHNGLVDWVNTNFQTYNNGILTRDQLIKTLHKELIKLDV